MDFGNYMKMPPKNKRVNHAPVILDLNKSYNYYIKKGEKNDK